MSFDSLFKSTCYILETKEQKKVLASDIQVLILNKHDFEQQTLESIVLFQKENYCRDRPCCHYYPTFK